MPIRKPLSPQKLTSAKTQAGKKAKGFDAFPEHVVVTDVNAVIVYANKAAGEATKFSPQEMIGKNPADLWGGNMPKEFYDKMWQTIKESKKPFIGNVKNTRRDGSQQWQELYITPLLDAKKEVKYFMGIEYAIPAPAVPKEQTPFERKAAVLFMSSPRNLLLIVAGKPGAVFYRLTVSGLQKIEAVEPADKTTQTGVFLHTCGEKLKAILAHDNFDAIYLFSSAQLAEAWQGLLKTLLINPAAVMIGDYAEQSEPQLLEKVRLNIYGAD